MHIVHCWDVSWQNTSYISPFFWILGEGAMFNIIAPPRPPCQAPPPPLCTFSFTKTDLFSVKPSTKGRRSCLRGAIYYRMHHDDNVTNVCVSLLCVNFFAFRNIWRSFPPARPSSSLRRSSLVIIAKSERKTFITFPFSFYARLNLVWTLHRCSIQGTSLHWSLQLSFSLHLTKERWITSIALKFEVFIDYNSSIKAPEWFS